MCGNQCQVKPLPERGSDVIKPINTPGKAPSLKEVVM